METSDTSPTKMALHSLHLYNLQKFFSVQKLKLELPQTRQFIFSLLFSMAR